MKRIFFSAIRNRQRRLKNQLPSKDHRRSQRHSRRRCLIETLEGRRLLTATIGNNIAVGTQLQNFRLAVAATAEYTAFFGGQSQAFAAIESLVDEVNEIVEKELAIHLDIVSGLDVVFTNSATDGYDNGNTSQMLGANTGILNAEYGSAFYDIGHVLGTLGSGGAGLAGLGVVNSTGKGRGASVSFDPSRDQFVELVTHELAHQFGAEHTFNANAFASTVGSRAGSNAYEPASGSTLMGYPGISGPDDLQSRPDRYFHAASFEEVQTLINQSAPPNTVTPLGNAVPSVSGGSDYAIPAGTPFALTATGSDADVGDVLTYTWEQLDLGPAMSLPIFDNGSSPLFRSFEPGEDSTRVFPRLSDLTDNVNTAAIGEALPTTNRDLNFRATVRDGNGGVHSDDVLVNVVNTGSSFALTSPNTGISWTGGTSQTVTWNVAGTDANGIDVANVAIDLSVDGGLTYSIPILSSTANDGTETITVPNVDVTDARLRVRSIGNVFFDISDVDFVIVPNGSAAGFSMTTDDGSTIVGEPGLVGSSPIDQYTLTPNTPVNGSVEVTVNSDAQTEVSTDGVNFAPSVTLTYSSSIAQTIFVRGLDDTDAEGMHNGTITHQVTSSTAAAYPVSTTINPVFVEIADDEWQPLVAVDFDQPTGSSPTRWTLVSSAFDSTESNLIREDGLRTGIGLSIDTSGSAGVNPSSYSGIPIRSPDLTSIDGNRIATGPIVMTWTGLTPSTDYHVYVLAGENFGSGTNIDQSVTVTGGNGPVVFEQDSTSTGNGLLVNGSVADADRALESDAVLVRSTVGGEIEVSVEYVGTSASTFSILSGVAIQEVATVSPPTATVSINNGDAQRSTLNQIQIVFDQIVDIDNVTGNAIEVVDADSDVAVTQFANIDISTGVTVVDITFDPTDDLVSPGGSLINGDYRLTLDAALITAGGVRLDGNRDGTPDDDLVVGAVDGFFRKYGDIDGNNMVDLLDFAQFRAAFGSTNADADFEFGFDNDNSGTINLLDFAQFRSNFGT